jgi:hypothetical protein
MSRSISGSGGDKDQKNPTPQRNDRIGGAMLGGNNGIQSAPWSLSKRHIAG